MKCSVLIPFRNLEKNPEIFQVIDSINSVENFDDYNILTMGSDLIDKPNVKSYIDRDKLGSVHAYNKLVKLSTSEYILIGTDEIGFEKNWPEFMTYLENDMRHKKFKICSPGNPGGISCMNRIGSLYYPIVRFPGFHKSVLDLIPGNNIYPSEFYGPYADHFVSIYALLTAGQMLFDCPNVHFLNFPHAQNDGSGKNIEKRNEEGLEILKRLVKKECNYEL